MFGYVKPFVPELRVKEHEFYRALYCGLCRAMKHRAGALCLSLRYDFVFLALIRLGLTGERPSIGTTRCLVHPLKKRPVMLPCETLSYCASVSALLLYHSTQDHKADGGWERIGAWLLDLPVRHMLRVSDVPDDLSVRVGDTLAKLKTCEERGDATADEAAEYFGCVLSDVFSFGLEGDRARIAAEVGRHTGRFITLIDALDDREKDRKSGAFNPFADGRYSDEEIRCALACELEALRAAASLIPYEDAGLASITDNIVSLGMPHVAETILKKQKTGADEAQKQAGENHDFRPL